MNKVKLSKKKIAVLAGSGYLPEEVSNSLKKLNIDFSIIRFEGVVSSTFNNNKLIDANFECISDLFRQLKSQNFDSIICCGYLPRPELDFTKIKEDSRVILEQIVKNFKFGDEAVFTSILKVFRDNELEPISIKDIIPDSFPANKVLTVSKPSEMDITDSVRAETIFTAISPADLGQSVVVRNDLCLAVETATGTDRMLDTLSISQKYDGKFYGGGILYKSPKIGQNPFLDHPVIGEQTILGVKKAGLNGIVIKQSNVIVLKLRETIKLANQLGIFIWSRNELAQ